MVLLIIIPIKWLFFWEYTLFSDKPIFFLKDHIGTTNYKVAYGNANIARIVTVLYCPILFVGKLSTFTGPKNMETIDLSQV